MARYRSLLAASLAGAALAAAGCGDDDGGDSPARTQDAPVNTATPSANPDTTPAPAGSDPETRTTRTDGE